MMTRQEAIAAGYTVYCIKCNKTYRHTPTKQYEDGHGGRQLPMCRCGCDLFANLTDDSQVK